MPAIIDLTVFYDKDKPRYDSYVQMCEVMLRDVREGHDVLGIFYGHPVVFVSPSHRAIAIAREEGYKARMLPGVSAEDYMFADLGFDPAMHGCITYEATELLIRNKPLSPLTHNIIWQVGGVGVGNMVFDNNKFHLLVDRLEKDFGLDHKVVHYIGAVFPIQTTIMDTFTIAELRKEDVIKQFVTVSTLYIPPRDASPFMPSMAHALGMSVASCEKCMYPSAKWAGESVQSMPAYGPRELAAIAQIDSHEPPKGHQVLRASPAMTKFMTDLALDIKFLEAYTANPAGTVDATEGLTTSERVALKLRNWEAVQVGMRATREDVASGRQYTRDDLTISSPRSAAFLLSLHATMDNNTTSGDQQVVAMVAVN